MDATAASLAPDRPGKTSIWTTARRAGKYDVCENAPDAVQPPLAIGSLDGVRTVFWQAYRHLFPPHALAAQAPNGCLVISWSVQDEPQARYPYAAPVMLRFDESLVDAMWKADPRTRARLARKHEPALREGLQGYDPFARLPNARVIVVG